MEIEFKLDSDIFIKRFNAHGLKFVKKIRTASIKSAWKFITLITKNWYSGRNSDDSGLNRPTGTLAKSWVHDINFNEDDGFITYIKTSVGYAEVHETGSSKKNIPIRTYVLKDFKEKGFNFFLSEYRNVITGEFK